MSFVGYDYSMTSSSSSDSDSDSENDTRTTEPKTEDPQQQPAQEPEEKVDEMPSVEELESKLRAAEDEITKQQKIITFWKTECERAYERLSSQHGDVDFRPTQNKRQRETTQYGCRQCGNYPKKTNCICPKAKKSRSKKQN
jgi:hypothetical protein